MGRDRETREDPESAVFRSSRRVTFVVRAGSSARRFSSSRVSRDPMGSVQIDVTETKPVKAPKLGLSGDWSAIADRLSTGEGSGVELTFTTGEPGEVLSVMGVVRNGTAYIATTDDKAETGTGDHILLDPSVFEVIRDGRAAIAIEMEGDHSCRLVSYTTFQELLNRPEPERPSVEIDAGSTEQRSATDPEPAKSHEVAITQTPQPAAADDPVKPSGTARLRALTTPRGFPDSIQASLKGVLSKLKPSFGAALLFQAEYVDGHSEYLLGFSGAQADREDEIEVAVNAALSASSRADFELGITFLDADDPMVVRISRVGFRLV